MIQGHPRFISLEGIDGSGKSTQIALLIEHLKNLGMESIQVREPGGTRISDEIRRLLLAPENTIAATTELLLYSAARAQLVAQIISPALADGKVVIADRFGWSTMAYQGFGRNLDRSQIQQLFAVACGSVWPSHTLLLDLPIPLMRARLAAGGRPADRMENENTAFFERVRQGYLTIAQENQDKFTVLDGSQTSGLLHQIILKHVLAWLVEPS